MLTCRQYGGFIAGAVVGVITIPIVQKSADPRTGWLISVGIVCVTMIITGLCAANGAKRVDYYNSLPTPEKIHFKSQIGLVIHNRAVICAALLLGAVTLVNTMSSALSLYYLRCVVENMGLKAVFSLVSLGISLVVIPMMPAMLRKFGKIKTVFIGMFVILLQSIWLLVRREYATDLEVIGMGFVGKPWLRIRECGGAGYDPRLHRLYRVEVWNGPGRVHQRHDHLYEEILLQLFHHDRGRCPGVCGVQCLRDLPGGHRHDRELKDRLSHCVNDRYGDPGEALSHYASLRKDHARGA